MEREESRRIAAALAHKAGQGAVAAQIADVTVSAWQEIEAALSPIIGQGGVAALYKRSLHVAGAAYPWLGGMHEGVQLALDLVALKLMLAQQSSAAAAAGGGALLQTFYELLASMVGSSLTERLLRSVWANFLIAPRAQEASP